MTTLKPKPACLYCGKPTNRGRRGEHVVQDALGGSRTLKDFPTGRVVCTDCNNGFLSRIDRELCSRSYLSFVASQQLDRHLWQAWDVDHSAGHVLVEARPAWADDQFMNSLVPYPQITFERRGPEVRGDAEEFQRFGLRDAGRVLFKAVRQAFRRWCKTGNGLHFERIESGFIEDGYRFPPRVFLRHTIDEIARNIHKDKQSIILRFTREEDKRFALYSLSMLDEGRNFDQWSRDRGSHLPTLACTFDIAETLRALMKIGFNLIAAYCEKTPVDHVTFERAVRIIRGEMQMQPAAFQMNGFVYAEDIKCIMAGDKDHSFRLMHIDGEWQVYSSFFGGRVGAFVRVPGPNHEDWNCADILAPIGSKDWAFTPSVVLRPMKVRVSWKGSGALTPSVQLHRSASSLRVDVQKRK
jgi:HNH endonuclease